LELSAPRHFQRKARGLSLSVSLDNVRAADTEAVQTVHGSAPLPRRLQQVCVRSVGRSRCVSGALVAAGVCPERWSQQVCARSVGRSRCVPGALVAAGVCPERWSACESDCCWFFGTGQTENGSLNDGRLPNFCVVRIGIGTGCNHGEANQRASRSRPKPLTTFPSLKGLHPSCVDSSCGSSVHVHLHCSLTVGRGGVACPRSGVGRSPTRCTCAPTTVTSRTCLARRWSSTAPRQVSFPPYRRVRIQGDQGRGGLGYRFTV
jgi:hypothetical protein